MRTIHILCLKEWLNSKKMMYNSEKVKSFFWKTLQCELCKESFEDKMKGTMFSVLDFEKPQDEYLVIESVKSAPAKVIHVLFLEKSDTFKIGRSIDTDMKIADISVSRLHSYIKILNGQLIVEDNGSKFGTLVKIKQPQEILKA